MVVNVVPGQQLKLKFIDDFINNLVNLVNFPYFSTLAVMRGYVYPLHFGAHKDAFSRITETPIALATLTLRVRKVIFITV